MFWYCWIYNLVKCNQWNNPYKKINVKRKALATSQKQNFTHFSQWLDARYSEYAGALQFLYDLKCIPGKWHPRGSGEIIVFNKVKH